MAVYRFRNHNGLTLGHAVGVKSDVYDLVKQAAERSPFNKMGAAPNGWSTEERTVKGNIKVFKVHVKTGIVFKSGFFMEQKSSSQKWEGSAKTIDYRLDLQSIENNWANWAIQTNGANSKTVATCLMAVNRCFSQSHLAHSLIQSALRNQICELTQ